MQKLFLALMLVLLGSLNVAAQKPAKISPADFKPVFGAWKGSLTYLDYGTGKPFSMPADVAIAQMGKSNQLLFIHSYPEEAEANETDTVSISADGMLLDGEKVVSKRKLQGGNREIVTEIMGIDGNDNKPARMRHTYTLGRNIYSVRKDVLFEGETKWIMRHEYRYEKRAN